MSKTIILGLNFFLIFFDLGVDFFENSCILISVMRETLKENKKLVCQVCQREDGAKSEWGGEIEVWEWANPCDHGTICDECNEDMLDER